MSFNNNLFKLDKETFKFCSEMKSDINLSALSGEQVRQIMNLKQSTSINKYDCNINDEVFELPENLGSMINVRIISPKLDDNNSSKLPLPIIIYCHGGGWVMGNKDSHDKIIKELSVRCNSVVVFPEYSLSPESKYPISIEQVYSVLQRCVDESIKRNWDSNKLYVAGDSAGGNFAVVLPLLSKQRNGPKISKVLALCPVLDADFEYQSYKDFGQGGFFLTTETMKWFWDQYTTSLEDRKHINVCPVLATSEQLQEYPEAMIITSEFDILRDGAELFANNLQLANQSVTLIRLESTVHCPMVVVNLDDTIACRNSMNDSINFLNK